MYISNQFVAFLVLFIKQLNNGLYFVYVDGDNKQVLKTLQDTIPEVCFVQIDQDNLPNLRESLSKGDKALFLDLSTDPYRIHDTIRALANVSALNLIYKVRGYCSEIIGAREAIRTIDYFDDGSEESVKQLCQWEPEVNQFKYSSFRRPFSPSSYFIIDNETLDDCGNYVGFHDRCGNGICAIHDVREAALNKDCAPYCPDGTNATDTSTLSRICPKCSRCPNLEPTWCCHTKLESSQKTLNRQNESEDLPENFTLIVVLACIGVILALA